MSCLMYHNQVRSISQQAFERLKTIPRQRLFWKANENDPRKHDKSHLGLYYTLPDEKSLIRIYGSSNIFHPNQNLFYKTLGRISLMIRRPALETIEYLRDIDDSNPNNKVLFYGDPGTGKIHTLNHLVHYLHLNQDRFILHIREFKRFTKIPRDHNESTSRPGRIDTPMDAALLLQQFKIQNSELLEKNKDTLLCSENYKWSLRESTNAGEPLIRVIEHGINRVNHASDCVAVLIKELTLAANTGKIKLVIVLNNVRHLFQYTSGYLKHADFKRVLIDEMTVPIAIKKSVRNTGRGVILLAACHDDRLKKQRATPREILGDEAMEIFDSSKQVLVPKYSKEEFESCMNYYQDIGWISRPEARTQETRDELRFISGLNPNQVEYLCQAI